MMDIPDGNLVLRPTEEFINNPTEFEGYSRVKDMPYMFMNGDYASSLKGDFKDPYVFQK